MSIDLAQRDLRQRDLLPPGALAACHALVIGVGAVGRQAALQLAAVGVGAMTLVDHDLVDVVNLAAQGYPPRDVGKLKVEATAEWCRSLNGELQIHPFAQRFARSSKGALACFRPAAHRLAVFCCVDSITARSIVWEAVRSRAGYFTDARMSGETLRVLSSAHPPADGYYHTTLFDQREAFVGACTARSTIFAASIAAGLMLGQFSRWLRRLPVDRDLMVNLLASEMTPR